MSKMDKTNENSFVISFLLTEKAPYIN